MRIAMTLLLAGLTLAGHCADTDAEIIRVGRDNWSFVTRDSSTRFIPFGTNFVFGDKKYLNMFGPDVYDREVYGQALAGLEQLGYNVVKVFLPIANVLPDPQEPGKATIAPGYLDNLEDFLALAQSHHIRAVVTLTSWGGNTIKWWHDGGEYFGRKPWKQDDGIDSVVVLEDFWSQLCTRFRDNPTVFAYTPAVEWSFPAGNLTWTHPSKQWGRLETEQGVFYWRAFLRARYEDEIDALNAAYGAEYGSFDEVPVVDYEYDQATRKYASPDAMVLDYQNFREWASMRYFRPQIEAMRRADPNHMVTISNHSRRPIGLWPGAARYFMGFSVPEQTELVDYLTSHDNHSRSELKPGQTIEDVVRGSIIQTRFCNAFRIKPLIIEEYSFASPDPEEVADNQEQMVRGTIGHACGWMNWYMLYPDKPNEADMPEGDTSAILNPDFTPTPWGLRAQKLVRELAEMDLSRKQAGVELHVDRARELVPREMGTLLTITGNWDDYEHPVDFVWPRNEWINMKLMEER